MTDARFAELATLPTEELRRRAFALARQRRDVGFFWEVIAHLPHADDTEQLESDPGMIGASIEDLLGLWREFTGRGGYGDAEPLLRAAFLDYLT